MPHKARQFISRTQQAIRARTVHPSRTEAAGRKWYQTPTWKRLRLEHLAEHPYCEECEREGKPIGQCIGNTVDHRTPHRGVWILFSDPNNLRTLCASHHSRKTAREDGGFGNRKKSS